MLINGSSTAILGSNIDAAVAVFMALINYMHKFVASTGVTFGYRVKVLVILYCAFPIPLSTLN